MLSDSKGDRLGRVVYTAEAPTKVILSGEHSVVYGYPAIVLAVEPKVRVQVHLTDDRIVRVSSGHLGAAEHDPMSGRTDGDRRLFPALEVLKRVLEVRDSKSGLTAETSGDVPVAAGMGSSASTFVSTALAAFQALDIKPTKEQLTEAAMVGERMVHGRPSGVDIEVAISGGAIRYVKGSESKLVGTSADLSLVVVNTGLERSTGDMVERFRSNLEAGGKEARNLLETMGTVTDRMEAALKEKNLSLVGRLMIVNHCLLSSFGVSVQLLDRVVAESIRAGALGAKLTGAGGGGSAIALVPPDLIPTVIRRMGEIGLKSFQARFSPDGARVWSS